MGYKHFCLDGTEILAESEVMEIALTSGLLIAVNPGSRGIREALNPVNLNVVS